MLSRINSFLKKIIYPGQDLRAFIVTRLSAAEIKEKVFIVNKTRDIDISDRHAMICLEPFSMAIWIGPDELTFIDPASISVFISKENRIRARMVLSLVEKIPQNNVTLLLYRVAQSKCFIANPIYRFITLAWFLKNKTSTYRERKFIAAFYTYPRKVILVSYKENGYYNIFPMDIQGHMKESGLYLLGLRHTNFTLEKVLDTKKLVIADTENADINTIYSLGRHLSKSPPSLEELSFGTKESSLFRFPIPDFSRSYKEVEITRNIDMGYHMLLIGKIVYEEKAADHSSSLYHIHFFEFKNSGYKSIANTGYS